MDSLILSGFRALRSLLTPGMMSVFVLCLITTIAALFGFVIVSGAFFTWLSEHLQGHDFAFLLPWIGSIGASVIAWFLFPGIMPIIVNFFDDRIARVIESHDYPAATQAQPPAFLPELLHDIRFTFLAVGLNILALPFYLLPLVNVLLFYGLNGYLLGREFFVMIARRHLPIHEAEALRNQHGRTIMTAGILLTIMATIPLLNFVAPFWGIAVMVHLYHSISKTPASQMLPPN